MRRKKQPDLLVVLALFVGLGFIITAVSQEMLSQYHSYLLSTQQSSKALQQPRPL